MNLTDTNEVLPTGVPHADTPLPKEDHTIQMTLNGRVLNVLKRYDLDPNKLFVLLAMYEDATPLLDIYDNSLANRKVIIDDYELLRCHGFIKTGTENSTTAYELDEKGKSFVEQIRLLFEDPQEEKPILGEYKKFCEDYLQLWPKIKLPSGVYARCSMVEIDKKMKAFFKVYKPALKAEGIKLTYDLVLTATKTYISRYAKKDYLYMVNSSYFIQKKEKSHLMDEILALKQGTTKTEDKWIKQV